MTEFIAAPYMRPKIPTITMRQLIDAVLQFMPTVIEGDYSVQEITCERGEDTHTAVYFGRDGQHRGAFLHLTGRALKSLDAKLGSYPFLISLHFTSRANPYWSDDYAAQG